MEKIKLKALTFDDVLLLPRYTDFLPAEADLATRISRNITLKIPLVSAAMDTVTESRMAIALAENGGIGIIHKNNSIEEQAQLVKAVKKYESGVVRDPTTIKSTKTIEELMQLTNELSISGMPVVDEGKLMGWNQWTNKVSDPAFTDHGLSSGGKFIGQNEGNENSGKPFVFSNRGEIEIMEQFFEAANNLDVEGFMKYVTDPFTFNGQELSLKDVKELFAARESQEWKPWAMLPIKISNTDPASGVLVYSTAEVKAKNGDSWKAEVSETYYFDLNGKISAISQFSRSIPDSKEE